MLPFGAGSRRLHSQMLEASPAPVTPVIGAITAGLGNQLFQYATARAVSLRIGRPLRLDLHYYSLKSNRAYRLESYDLPAAPATDEELSHFLTPMYRHRFGRRLAFSTNRILPFRWRRIIAERSPRFDVRVLQIRWSVYLSGFWQSEQYFADYSDTIRHELTLTTPVPLAYRGVLEQIDACESVGLIVRRGDYLGISNTQGICTLEYYRRALETINTKVPGCRVFVFSDDIPWCRENLDWQTDMVFVPSVTPERPEEHLRILSRCQHFILANSSFAWWGAWLALRADKIVIGPQKWMHPWKPFIDLMPTSWIKVN